MLTLIFVDDEKEGRGPCLNRPCALDLIVEDDQIVKGVAFDGKELPMRQVALAIVVDASQQHLNRLARALTDKLKAAAVKAAAVKLAVQSRGTGGEFARGAVVTE